MLKDKKETNSGSEDSGGSGTGIFVGMLAIPIVLGVFVFTSPAVLGMFKDLLVDFGASENSLLPLICTGAFYCLFTVVIGLAAYLNLNENEGGDYPDNAR